LAQKDECEFQQSDSGQHDLLSLGAVCFVILESKLLKAELPVLDTMDVHYKDHLSAILKGVIRISSSE
jgi:hypothetical protein